MRNSLSLFIVILFISSCRKDTAIPGTDHVGTVTPNTPFVPLTIGSFWVYDYYQADTLGNEIYIHRDTVRIVKDSIINGNKYAVYKGRYDFYYPSSLLFRRDSSGYLVDEKGFIEFSATNFTDTLEIFHLDTLGSVLYYKMAHKDSIIAVPAGSFIASKYERVAHFPNNMPHIHCGGTYYSSGVGVVMSRIKYTGSYNYLDSKLVSYYIAP